MAIPKPEISEAAEHILDFFKQTHPREVCGRERTLVKRLEILSSWLEVKKYDKRVECGSCEVGLYGERWRARRLRELYQRADEAEIFTYGKENINTMSGGHSPDLPRSERVGFINETTQNMLRIFHRDYIGNPYGDYNLKLVELAPFYRSLVGEAESIEARSFEIRHEICSDEDFRQRAAQAAEEARDGISGSEDIPVRGLYLLEEFKRGEQVLPLLRRVERLYSNTITLTKTILDLSNR